MKIDMNILQKMKDAHAIQGSAGNYNDSDYMLGMYNGMEHMMAVVEERKPKFLSKDCINLVTECGKEKTIMQKVIRSVSNEMLPKELNDLLADGWAVKSVTPIILSESTYIEYVIEKA